MSTSTLTPSWIGDHPLGLNETAQLLLGPLEMRIHRAPQHWRVTLFRDLQFSTRDPSLNLSFSGDSSTTPAESHRFGFRESPAKFCLAAALADRPMIIRPDTAFTMLPDEEVRAYVSSPLWVQLWVKSQDQPRLLLEFPTHRPSDTWFGLDTREGLLCYAGTSRLRLAPTDEVTPRHRATTPVVLRNVAEEPMHVARIRLPVRHLSLFPGPADSFWTERITLTHRSGESNDSIEVDHEAPRESLSPTPLSPPRVPEERAFVARAFESVFRLP